LEIFQLYDLIYKVSLGLKTKPRSTHGASSPAGS